MPPNKEHRGMSHRSAPARSRCAITGEELPSHRLVAVDHLRPSLAARIREDHPDLPDQAAISRREADRYRALYVEDLLRAERGELTGRLRGGEHVWREALRRTRFLWR